MSTTARLTAAGLPYPRGDWGSDHADWGTPAAELRNQLVSS